MPKGNLLSNERPYSVTVPIRVAVYNFVSVPDVLVRTGMASSRTEARRLVSERQVWTDSERGGEFVWDRLVQVEPVGESCLAEDGDIWCVGKFDRRKRSGDALSHRISFGIPIDDVRRYGMRHRHASRVHF